MHLWSSAIFSMADQFKTTFTYQNWFQLNNFGAHIPRNHCLLKSDLNINFGVFKYNFYCPNDRSFSYLHKNSCRYHDCAIEYRVIGLYSKVNNFDWFI